MHFLIDVMYVLDIMKNNMKPLLVTGCPRSGTTWVGKMMSKCKNTAYLHEPFNIAYSQLNPGKRSTNLEYWYSYI